MANIICGCSNPSSELLARASKPISAAVPQAKNRLEMGHDGPVAEQTVELAKGLGPIRGASLGSCGCRIRTVDGRLETRRWPIATDRRLEGRRFLDSMAIDECAVGASQVAHFESVGMDGQLGMLLGNRIARQGQRQIGKAADAKGAAVDIHQADRTVRFVPLRQHPIRPRSHRFDRLL